ncbi:MAG: hypothetical protein ACM3VY_00415, partial [Candidatus Bathyarchaeota archaeon]
MNLPSRDHTAQEALTVVTNSASVAPSEYSTEARYEKPSIDSAIPEDLIPAHLPPVFRLVKIDTVSAADGRSLTMTAVIFHERATLRVVWTSRQLDSRLQRGALVSVSWKGTPSVCQDGAVTIARLVPIAKPIWAVNLFDTVPPAWVKDRGLVARARSLVGR